MNNYKNILFAVVFSLLFLAFAYGSDYEFAKFSFYGSTAQASDHMRFCDFNSSLFQSESIDNPIAWRYFQNCPDQDIIIRGEPFRCLFGGHFGEEQYYDRFFSEITPNLLQMRSEYASILPGKLYPYDCYSQQIDWGECIIPGIPSRLNLHCAIKEKIIPLEAVKICEALCPENNPSCGKIPKQSILGLTIAEEIMGQGFPAYLDCPDADPSSCGLNLLSPCSEPYDFPGCQYDGWINENSQGPDLLNLFKNQYKEETKLSQDSWWKWTDTDIRYNIRQWAFNRSMDAYGVIGNDLSAALQQQCSAGDIPIGSYIVMDHVHDLRQDHFTTLKFNTDVSEYEDNIVTLPHGVMVEASSAETYRVDKWSDGLPEWISYPNMVTLTQFNLNPNNWYNEAIWESAGLKAINKTPHLLQLLTNGGEPTSLKPWIPRSDALFSAQDTFARTFYIRSKMSSKGFLNSLLSAQENNNSWTLNLGDKNKSVGGIITYTKYLIPIPPGKFRVAKKIKIPFNTEYDNNQERLPWHIGMWYEGTWVHFCRDVYEYEYEGHTYYICRWATFLSPFSDSIIIEDYYSSEDGQYKRVIKSDENCNYIGSFNNTDHCTGYNYCGCIFDWTSKSSSYISLLIDNGGSGGGRFDTIDLSFNKDFGNKEIFNAYYSGNGNSCGSSPGSRCNYFKAPYIIQIGEDSDPHKTIFDQPPEIHVADTDDNQPENMSERWYNSYRFIP